MTSSVLHRGLLVGVASLMAMAGIAEAGHKGRGRSCGGSRSSVSISIGSGWCGSGWSAGFVSSNRGWCAPRRWSRCNTFVPRCGYTVVRPVVVCSPRFVVTDCSPSFVVAPRTVTRVETFISDASPMQTHRSTAYASTSRTVNDYRNWQAQTQLAERATIATDPVVVAERPAPVEPSVHFAFVVDAPTRERRPTTSVAIAGRAPLPEEVPAVATAAPEVVGPPAPTVVAAR